MRSLQKNETTKNDKKAKKAKKKPKTPKCQQKSEIEKKKEYNEI